MKFALIGLMIAAVAGVASADLDLSWSATNLGGGLTGYTFIASSTGPEANNGAWAANLRFAAANDATLVQQVVMGTFQINEEATADALIPTQKDQDSWVYTPWQALNNVTDPNGNPVPPFNYGADWYDIHVGTGKGVADTLNLAYVVADGDLSWAGTLSREGDNFPQSGVTPEPATMSLLGLGALALIRRRR